MKVTVNKKKIPKEGRSSLTKAVKNVKKILQTKKAKGKIKKTPVVLKKKRKNLDQKELNRGLVYIGHIPHGFYEKQMRDYFTQFGSVSRVKISRSKETGKSKGYGYVEFIDTDVAKVAAETMNNYLMCGRLLKSRYIPPEEQHNKYFAQSQWTSNHYPKKLNRIKEIIKQSAPETKEQHKKFVDRSLRKLTKLSAKLEKQGIELEFPVTLEQK